MSHESELDARAEAFRRAHGKDIRAAQKSPRRVHSLLRSAIYSGELVANDRLLEDDLVEEFGTSRNAVREALALLATEGLVSRSTRVGTVVVGGIVTLTIEGLDAPPEGATDTPRYVHVESNDVPSTPLLRRKLATEDRVLRMNEFIIVAGDRAFCLYTAYTRVGEPTLSFTDFGPGWNLSDAFERAFGVPLATVETHVSAVGCEPRTSRKLDVPEGTPTLLRARLLMDASGEHREYSYCYVVDRNVVMRSLTTFVDGVPHRA